MPVQGGKGLADSVNNYLIPEDAGPTMAGIYFAGLGYHHVV